jgi:hypothetical protein
MVIYERRRSPVYLVSSSDLVDPFYPIRQDLTRMAFGFFFLDLADGLTETADPEPEIFQLLLWALRALADGGEARSLARFLEIRFLKAHGLLPDPKTLPLSPGARLTLRQMEGTPLEKIRTIRMNRSILDELEIFSTERIGCLMERPLKSREVLRQLV